MVVADTSVTRLLREWRQGSENALSALMPIIYREVHRLALAQLRRERGDHSLSPTELVSEAFLRLVEQDLPEWQDRAHFFGIAARHMRQVLVDHARARAAEKRGGGQTLLVFDEGQVARARPVELIALDEALAALALRDERKARVVELHYFGGLSQREIAEVLGVHVNTVASDQKLGEAWLTRQLKASR